MHTEAKEGLILVVAAEIPIPLLQIAKSQSSQTHVEKNFRISRCYDKIGRHFP